MTNPEHFRSRAAAYRRLALASLDERCAGDLFEIASLFNSMADDLTFLIRPSRPPSQPQASAISAILAWARSLLPLSLAVNFKL